MPLAGKEILVVEDVDDQRLLAKRILENVGLTVIEAASVDEAIQALAKKAPHLVLLDLQMPRVSGFELLAKKSLYPTLSNAPIVVASSLQDKDSIFKAISLGAVDYVVKPLVAQVLLRKVRKHLKDVEFQSYEFNDPKPMLTVSTHGQITKLSQTHFFLDSPIKISSKSRLSLTGKGVDELGLSKCAFVSDPIPFVRGVSGLYSGKIHAVGMDQAILTKMRKEGK